MHRMSATLRKIVYRGTVTLSSAMGALLLALARRQLDLVRLREVMRNTLQISSMVFLILIGASVFSLVFRGYGGDDGVRAVLEALPGGVAGAVIVVMLVMFLLGFVLDFIEITFVVVPIVEPGDADAWSTHLAEAAEALLPLEHD